MQRGSLQYLRDPNEGSLGALPLPLASCGWPRLGSSGACFFRGLDPGCRAMCFAAAPWFSTSLSIFAIETLLACTALNFQAGGTCCNSAKRELEIIAKPLRLLHESLLSGRSFLAPCAQKLATTLCPCSLSPAVCQFVLVAARRFLQSVTYFVGRSARAPSCRFAFAAFDLLVALV